MTSFFHLFNIFHFVSILLLMSDPCLLNFNYRNKMGTFIYFINTYISVYIYIHKTYIKSSNYNFTDGGRVFAPLYNLQYINTLFDFNIIHDISKLFFIFALFLKTFFPPRPARRPPAGRLNNVFKNNEKNEK